MQKYALRDRQGRTAPVRDLDEYLGQINALVDEIEDWPRLSADPLVSVAMTTYNHENYIREALNSVLLQQVAFSYEIVIGEDKSTDRTREIVCEYQKRHPDIIRLRLAKRNLYSQGLKPGVGVRASCRGKYIALLEGDDYWTDPTKLQQQVDFLERNPAYVLCVSGFTTVNEETNESSQEIWIPPDVDRNGEGYTFVLDDTRKGWITKTLTALFRNDLEINAQQLKYEHGRDINLFYHILKGGSKAFYFTKSMGMYRIHRGGVNSMKQGEPNTNAAYEIYRELYQVNRDDFSRHMSFRHTLGLLVYDRANSYSHNTLSRRFSLFFQALLLIRSFGDLRFMISAMIPQFSRIRRVFR